LFMAKLPVRLVTFVCDICSREARKIAEFSPLFPRLPQKKTARYPQRAAPAGDRATYGKIVL
ncbi:MAG: hypothetical protein KGI75_32150, partial [Rhizobiaceae bacterium]|nr:hypothetical protein [Rhizobiaceae bacterium]